MPLQNKPITEIFPNLAQRLVRGDIAWSNLTEVSLEEQRFLEARGICSILLLPFIVNGELVGFIGLENCLEGRVVAINRNYIFASNSSCYFSCL